MAGWLRAAEQLLTRIDQTAATSLRSKENHKSTTSDSEYSDPDLSDNGKNESRSSIRQVPSAPIPRESSIPNIYSKETSQNVSSSPASALRTASHGSSSLRPSESRAKVLNPSPSLQSPYDSEASEADDWTELLRHGEANSSVSNGGGSSNSGIRVSFSGQVEAPGLTKSTSKDKKLGLRSEPSRSRQISSPSVSFRNESAASNFQESHQSRGQESVHVETRASSKKVFGERATPQAGSMVEKGAAEILAAARNFRNEKEKALSKTSQQPLSQEAFDKEAEKPKPPEKLFSTTAGKSSDPNPDILSEYDLTVKPGTESTGGSSIAGFASLQKDVVLPRTNQYSDVMTVGNPNSLSKVANFSDKSKPNNLAHSLADTASSDISNVEIVNVDLNLSLSEEKSEKLNEQRGQTISEPSSSVNPIQTLPEKSSKPTHPSLNTTLNPPPFSPAMDANTFSKISTHPASIVDKGYSNEIRANTQSDSLQNLSLQGIAAIGGLSHQPREAPRNSSSPELLGGEPNPKALTDRDKSVNDLLQFLLRNEKETEGTTEASGHVKTNDSWTEAEEKSGSQQGTRGVHGEHQSVSHSQKGEDRNSVGDAVLAESRVGNEIGVTETLEAVSKAGEHEGESKGGGATGEGKDLKENADDNVRHLTGGEKDGTIVNGKELKEGEKREGAAAGRTRAFTKDLNDVKPSTEPAGNTKDSFLTPEQTRTVENLTSEGESAEPSSQLDKGDDWSKRQDFNSLGKVPTEKIDSGKAEDLLDAYLEQVLLKSGKGEGEEGNFSALTNGDVPRVAKLPALPPRQKNLSGRSRAKMGDEILKRKGLGRGVGTSSRDLSDTRARKDHGNGAKVEGKKSDLEEEKDSSDESSDSGSESESEEDDAASREALERAALLKAEQDRAILLARELSAFSLVKEALREREEIVLKLSQEREGIQRASAEASEQHAKEIAKLRALMMEGMTAMVVEKNAHTSTRMELQTREAELEEENIAKASALAAAQRALEEEVKNVSEAKEILEALERSKAQLERELSEMEGKERKQRESGCGREGLSATPSHLRLGPEREPSHLEDIQRLSVRMAERQRHTRELEEKIAQVQMSQKQPSEVERELELRLKQLINLLIQKQSQVEALASEKSTLSLRLETVSSSLAEERSSSSRSMRRKSSMLASTDWPAGEEDIEFGLSRSYTLIRSKRLLLGDMDYGYGGRANAIVGHLANFAWSLDSWVLGGASYIKTNRIARFIVWGYLVLLHFWVLFVYLMHA